MKLNNQGNAVNGTKRFGTFAGVFTPSILTILGVIMYFRMGWLVGNAGLGGALLVIFLAHLISYSTGLSVSSIATNRTVGAGGAYFMISRSLGAPAGAAIGIPLFLAQALSVTFYIVGFSDSVSQLIPTVDARLTGTVVCLILAGVTFKSAELAIRVQYFVLGAIGLSLLSLFLGTSNAQPEEIAFWNPSGAGFGAVFAVFFPAVTGIMAGVSMSGDLKDPRRALPRGTLMAITVGLVVYVTVPVVLALNFDQDTLVNRMDTVWLMARVPALIYVGVWGATLSSALGSLLAAPRTLQALASDRIVFPFLARGSGPSNEPRIGIILTFVLAEVGILLGNLDAIASVLTMFFLAAYGVTNLAFGLERWASSPSFHPTFRVPAWVGILGAFACFYVMSVINLAAMLAAVIICSGIYLIAKHRALDTTYGDARHGIWAATVLTALQRLRRAKYHGLNWRPNLIVLAGNLAKRSFLLELGSSIVQERGMVTYLHILKGTVQEQSAKRKELLSLLESQFTEDHPNVFCRVDIAEDIYSGAVSAVQSYGLGTVEANTVILGWLTKEERAGVYVKMLKDLAALDRSLLVVRFNPERGYGLRSKIDIWWRGLRSNGAMMLMLAFLLDSDKRFQGAQVRVITVVENETQREQAEKNLTEILLKSRLEASPVVLLRKGRQVTEIMREESGNADLALVGLRLPESDETSSEFLKSYKDILDGLPSTILVCSAESFSGTPVLFDGGTEE